jgi:hypothetical protein
MLPKAELSDSETELLAVSWMLWLDEAAIAEKKSSPSAEKSVTLFSLIIINRVT